MRWSSTWFCLLTFFENIPNFHLGRAVRFGSYHYRMDIATPDFLFNEGRVFCFNGLNQVLEILDIRKHRIVGDAFIDVGWACSEPKILDTLLNEIISNKYFIAPLALLD
jgi:hypothetical protein